jgi:hypothetical protein
MSARERLVMGAVALAFMLTAGALSLLLPWNREADPLVLAVLMLIYAAATRVGFEIGSGWATPEQLAFGPLLFLAPLPIVAPLVVLSQLLANGPDFVRRERHFDRMLNPFADSWFVLGPVIVLGVLAPGAPRLEHLGVYALALAAYLVVGLATAVVTERLAYGLRVGEIVRSAGWSFRIDAVLAPVALAMAAVAYEEPVALAAILPLLWLLSVFSRERKERYTAALELNQAYRGTVMLLSDVVEFEDGYTADHSRSVVELVNAVAEELDLERDARQELEFAALLHDVGKIAIPKEILNKPAKLTDEEFELIKSHTIEGQVMLDRVGGLLARVGRVVRSCHERWDGKGYPDGLAERQTPLAARIVFCCDAYSAMTTDRPYRAAMSREDAVVELRENAGTQFDPYVADALIRVVERLVPTPPATVEGVRAVVAAAV